MHIGPQSAIQDCYLDQPYTLSGRVIDPVTGTVSWLEKQVHLQRKDLEVLALLASNSGAIVARAAFIAMVWNGNDLVGDRGVSDKIFALRRALADADEQRPIIRTIPRRGYQLCVPPEPLPPESLRVRVEPAFAPGAAIVGCPGWRLQRQLSKSDISESWLAEAEDQQIAPRVFSFCRSEAHLRRLQRETTLLRYLSETLGERKDLALVRDWQLQEPPYFLARDYCTYGSLNEWAKAVGGLATQSLQRRTALMLTLTAAVASVHEIGVVHGQISATNVLLDDDKDAAGPQLKLSAFDLGALRDPTQLAALKITAAGLSFVDGVQAPQIGDDIAALGLLLLQLAVGDFSAEADSTWLQRIPNSEWRELIAACFGVTSARPSATQLHQRLRGGGATEKAELVENPEAIQRPSPVPARATLLGQFVGPYRLTDKLGEGGMGSVYLAEQREPVQRQVAVKLIKVGMDTTDVLARFEAERQALALMNHVNVAAVYDAGAAQSGRPYFAMEYVPGLEITAHCDERELDVRSRIELFLQVCDGVLHAHQKGIIHRDLKPSNILIKSAQGQAATAKIIDFGVAKSLQRKLGNLIAHTELGSFVGTRTYSSPEQINGNVVALDTRTDTYSLGVVLYELLAGVTPYDEDQLAAKSPLELSKLISSAEPPTLLKRFVSLDAKFEVEIAARRKLTVAQMKQTLSSDLAWIVAKCLERDPNARYASVLELEKDLRRWLENRPVEARPITWRYRMGKMVRRNWAAVTLGSVVTLAFVLTGTAAVIGFLRSERALADAELAAEFQVKQIQTINPAKMGNALREILTAELNLGAAADNDLVKSRLAAINMTDVTLKQLDAMYFEPALAAIEKDFSDSPLLQARLMQSLGENLQEVGRYEKAKQVFETVLAQRIKLLGASDALVLETLLFRGMANEGLGMNRLAEADYRATLKDLRRHLGVRHPQTILAMTTLGEFLLVDARAEEAVQLLEEALESARAAFGNKDERVLSILIVYSVGTLHLGRVEKAELLAQEAVDGLTAKYGKVHPQSLKALSMLASVLFERGSLDLAESYCTEVLKGSEQLFGSKSYQALEARNNLAVVLDGKGRYAEAIALHRETLRDLQLVFGADHPATLMSQMQLAAALRERAEFAEAEQLLTLAIQLSSRQRQESTITCDGMYYLAQVMRDQGKFDEAERLLSLALEVRRRISGDNHKETLKAKQELQSLRAQRATATSQ